jgi:hypothetical protein
MNSKVRDYIAQQNRLRQLEKQGRGDSEDAYYIRELMEDLWSGFSSEEAAEASRSNGRKTLTEG